MLDHHGSLPSHSTPPCTLTHRELPPSDATNSTNQLPTTEPAERGIPTLPTHAVRPWHQCARGLCDVLWLRRWTTGWSLCSVAPGWTRFAMAASKGSKRRIMQSTTSIADCYARCAELCRLRYAQGPARDPGVFPSLNSFRSTAPSANASRKGTLKLLARQDGTGMVFAVDGGVEM